MALPQNRQAVQDLLAILKPRIIGLTHPGFACSCGAVHKGPSRVIDVNPGGNSYPGQEVFWYMWTADMQDDCGKSWSIGLNTFIPLEELKALFSKAFGPNPQTKSPYDLKVSGYERGQAGLPTAVRIEETTTQIRFSFDWGKDQRTAQTLCEIYRSSAKRIPLTNAETFARIVAALASAHPDVYAGGPDPEGPGESLWHKDYQSALRRAVVHANHIFFQNVGDTWISGSPKTYYTNMDVVFMKIPVKD